MIHVEIPAHHPKWPMYCHRCGQLADGFNVSKDLGPGYAWGFAAMACLKCKVVAFPIQDDNRAPTRQETELAFQQLYGRRFRFEWHSKVTLRWLCRRGDPMFAQQAQLCQEAMRLRNEIATDGIPSRDELILELKGCLDNLQRTDDSEEEIRSGLELMSKVLLFTEAAVEVATEDFHRQRRMFYILGDDLRIAEADDPRDHKTWMQEVGDSGSYSDAIRGFSDDTGVYAYKGPSWDLGTSDLEHFKNMLPMLQARLKLKGNLEVWAGAIPGIPGTRWPGRRKIGKLIDIIS